MTDKSAPVTAISSATERSPLYRLENRGWLKAEWKTTEGGREAKYYSVTRAGRKQLESETPGWKRLCEAISLVLEHAE